MRSFTDIGRAFVGAPNQKAPRAASVRSSAPEPAIHAGNPGSRISPDNVRAHLSGYGGENTIDYVTDSLDLIASTACSADYHFEREDQKLVRHKTDKTPNDVEEAPGDLTALFETPNPWMDWTELLTLTIIDRYMAGNAYWLKDGVKSIADKPNALYRLNPERVTVIPGKTRMIDHYEYQVPNATEPLKFGPHQIVHHRRPNPHSEHVGLSVVANAPTVFDTELAMGESMKAYYENGTRLSGVLETDRTVTPSLFNKIKRQIQTMYAGARNAYRVPVFEAGLKWKTISGSAAEAEYRHLAPLLMNRLTAMFRVPKALLGLVDGLDRASVREAHRMFDSKTMRTLLDQMQATISRQLTRPAWHVNFVFDYEYVMPIEDQLDLGQAFASLPGVTVGEVRERVGLERLGDDFKDAEGKVIDDIVLNLPGENDNASKIKDRNLGSEPGRPPKPENTASFNGNSPTDPDAAVR